MKFTRLQRANEYDVRHWLEQALDLTPYQRSKMRDEEIPRFSPYYFYERKPIQKTKFLWRLTTIFYLVYVLLLIIFCSLKWVFTGNHYLGQSFLEGFHYRWQEKIGW